MLQPWAANLPVRSADLSLVAGKPPGHNRPTPGQPAGYTPALELARAGCRKAKGRLNSAAVLTGWIHRPVCLTRR